MLFRFGYLSGRCLNQYVRWLTTCCGHSWLLPVDGAVETTAIARVSLYGGCRLCLRGGGYCIVEVRHAGH